MRDLVVIKDDLQIPLADFGMILHIVHNQRPPVPGGNLLIRPSHPPRFVLTAPQAVVGFFHHPRVEGFGVAEIFDDD